MLVLVISSKSKNSGDHYVDDTGCFSVINITLTSCWLYQILIVF